MMLRNTAVDSLMPTHGDARIAAPPPVFILAPHPRSGTNFLSEILLMHEEFQLPNMIWEDHVLVHSHLLEKYAVLTAKSKGWDKKTIGDQQYPESIFRNLGVGILAFLFEHIEQDKRLLSKTPRGYNINNFFRLFPGAKLLILIRDGRDVVQSADRSRRHRFFGFEWHAYQWAKGARPILEFMEGAGRGLQGTAWKLVKYEDLVHCPETTVRDLLPFLDIVADTFPVSRIKDLPLLGSSFHHGGRGKVHWEPIAKPQTLQPIGRWKSWDSWRKFKFKKIAGKELIRLGYVESNHW